jgi:hypothetical protein
MGAEVPPTAAKHSHYFARHKRAILLISLGIVIGGLLETLGFYAGDSVLHLP